MADWFPHFLLFLVLLDVIPNLFLRHTWFSFGWLLLNYSSFTCFLSYAESSVVFVHLSAWLPLCLPSFSWAGVEPDLLWEARRTLKGEQVAACVWRRLLGDSATTDSPPDGETWLTKSAWREPWLAWFPCSKKGELSFLVG